VAEPNRTKRCIAVVGGANTDIVGHSFAPLVAHDSNPGAVRVSSGGVGRNIAENLARLGIETQLVTALGGDANAAELERGCRLVGIGMEYTLVASELPGSLYLAILDDAGEMELAMNDMRALALLTPNALTDRREALDGAALVVADANLSADSLGWLVGECTTPILLDPVSAAKAAHARGILGSLAALKCNALEAATLLEVAEPRSKAQIEYAAEKLLARGVGTVYLTADRVGVCFATGEQLGWLDPPHCRVVNATGAGDAFTAGVAAAMLDGKDAAACAAYGTAMAGIALGSDDTVSRSVSRAAVEVALEEMCGDPYV